MPQSSSPKAEPLPPSLRRSADRLATALAARNRAVYRRALAQHAAALGAKTPRHVQSASVKEAIGERARVSADSLTRTHLEARRRFYEQTGSVQAAKELYRQWVAERAPMVAQFEAGMATNAAASDFRRNNADVLRGTAHVDPAETDSSDICADLIAVGKVDLADATDDLPAHPRCPHLWVQSYESVDDPGALWVGGPDDSEENDNDNS